MKITKFRVLTLILISIEIFLGLFKDYIVEIISNNDIFKTLNFNINYILILLLILCLVLVFIEYFQEKEEHKFYENEHKKDNNNFYIRQKVKLKEILLQQVSTEINSRLEQSLHNRVYIILNKEQDSSQVENPWRMYIKVLNDKPKTRLLKNTEIMTVFDQEDVDGRLLILGEPGSGKTTMLLKLAEELVKRFKKDFTQPVPLLFSLSTWKDENQSINDWLIEQLKDKYGVRKDIGKHLVDSQEIIPLLDGLDELAAERQELCVREINEFLKFENWVNPLVLCSRTKEYQHYKTLLQLNTSLELCNFNPQQVYKYLRSTGNTELWNSISYDADLSNLARIPLLLNIIVLAAQEISVENWKKLKSSDERLDYLFEAYIRRMLATKKLVQNYKGKKPIEKQIKRELGRLAQQLINNNITEFFIKDIQPYWLTNKFQMFVYILIVRGLVSGMSVFLISVLIPGQISGLIIGFILEIIIFLLIKDKIETINFLKLNQNETIFVLTIGFSYGLIIGLTNGMIDGLTNGLIIGLTNGLTNGLIIGLFYGLIIGLFYGLSSMLIDDMFDRKISKDKNKFLLNQGIRQSITNTIITPLVIGLFTAPLIFIFMANLGEDLEDKSLIFVLIQTISNINFYDFLIVNLSLGLWLGLLIIRLRHGTETIKHLVLRALLWYYSDIPWNYTKFLDYCKDRLFLQRVDGSYRFMHDLLRQHFAKKYAKSNNANSL